MKGELILSLADRETKDLLVVCVCDLRERNKADISATGLGPVYVKERKERENERITEIF